MASSAASAVFSACFLALRRSRFFRFASRFFAAAASSFASPLAIASLSVTSTGSVAGIVAEL